MKAFRAFEKFIYRRRKRLALATAGFVLLMLAALLTYAHIFGPVNIYGTAENFIVTPGESVDQVASDLVEKGYVRSPWAFRVAYFAATTRMQVKAGGYQLAASMDTWSIGKVLAAPPPLAFVTVPAGYRKEQIADLLADALNWSPLQKLTFNLASPATLSEGVYAPGLYLIPAGEAPAMVAKRLYDRFVDTTASYARTASAEGLSWPQVLTMASLIEREAAKNDKQLVAGILWNRIHKGMKLQVDATLQYVKGTSSNWWPVVRPDFKSFASPFNTYKYTGLPPHPIATPSLASIDAVLHPTKTSCLYYLHDDDHAIHCAATYAGQVQNVNKYLK